jgi:hypothetical protein
MDTRLLITHERAGETTAFRLGSPTSYAVASPIGLPNLLLNLARPSHLQNVAPRFG